MAEEPKKAKVFSKKRTRKNAWIQSINDEKSKTFFGQKYFPIRHHGRRWGVNSSKMRNFCYNQNRLGEWSLDIFAVLYRILFLWCIWLKGQCYSIKCDKWWLNPWFLNCSLMTSLYTFWHKAARRIRKRDRHSLVHKCNKLVIYNNAPFKHFAALTMHSCIKIDEHCQQCQNRQ